MKKVLFIALAAFLAASLSFGCKQSGNNGQTVVLDEDTTVIVAEDPSLFDEEIAVEEGQETWKSFGGTYFFFNGEDEQLVVDFPLPQDSGCITLRYKGMDYVATADETTGKIVAKDSLGHVVFKGYFYDGGNTVKGLFKGEPIMLEGSGD